MALSAETVAPRFIRGQREITLKSGKSAQLHWADAVLLEDYEAIGITNVLELVFQQSNQLQQKRDQWFQPLRQDILTWVEMDGYVVGTGAVWHPHLFSGVNPESPFAGTSYKLHSGAVLEEYRNDGIGGHLIAQRMQIIDELTGEALIFSDFGNFSHYKGFLRNLTDNLDIFADNNTFIPFYTATFNNLIKVEFIGEFIDGEYPHYPCHTYMLEMHNLSLRQQNELYNVIYLSSGRLDINKLSFENIEFISSGIALPNMAADPQAYLEARVETAKWYGVQTKNIKNNSQPKVIIKEQQNLRIAVL